ncbi:MAG: UvrD-helicase domain-containing protein [Chlamydiia bacterium]|nr:UvrD-helicase domain-containing protein [Chlamydiia bacterium]
MQSLNPQQQQAVAHIEGPMLVLAGAGSGKTRVVTYRIAHLLDIGVLPSDILAVTFTNKAAEEMRTRIRMLKSAHILTCTFHSLGARILRESIGHLGYLNDFTIYDEEDSEKLLKSCLEQLNISNEKGLLRQIRNAISTAKNNLSDNIEAYPEVYDLYQTKLRESQALDFDDLLYLTVKLLKEHESVRQEYQKRWLFLLIDEYQDTNAAQYHIAKLLSEQHHNLFAVGDPDQSIYSWRGARYQNILNFESDFPGARIITLDQNYRSTNTILQAANALIQHNANRYEKKLWSQIGEGDKIGIFIAQTERAEADFVAKQILKHALDQHISFNEIAIFYRTNAQSRAFEDALLSRKINYTLIGGLSFYQRREIKDILSLLKMVISNADLLAWLRTINLPKRGLGPTTLEKITLAASKNGTPIFTFSEQLLERPHADVKLSGKQLQGLTDYVKLIHHLRARRPSIPLHELISEAISESRYLSYLEEDAETCQDRKENLNELIGKASEWEKEQPQPSLSRFLEELSLNAHVEEDDYVPSVKLMTLHNSKGLEFNVVFLAGLCEDLFPHINSKDSEEAIEEERRLCYVGMTRAKRHLYLCSSLYRFTWGAEQRMEPSRFLKEVPAQYLQNFSPVLHTIQEESDYSGFTTGDRVLHQEFGEGIVKKAYQGTFGLTYEVYFPSHNLTRNLAAKYAKLVAVNSRPLA